VGPFVYVIGETTGLQTWGACGQVSGRIELESPFHLTCNGAEIHGWVTGAQKIVNVELFLNNTALGSAQLGGPPRLDVSSKTPVQMWRANVNLDATARGEYTLRAIGTDILGNRRQFASKRCSSPDRDRTARRRAGAPCASSFPQRSSVRPTSGRPHLLWADPRRCSRLPRRSPHPASSSGADRRRRSPPAGSPA
jgi:hypothetical protein